MKAESAILTGVAAPPTFFGLPPTFLLLAGGSALMTLVICVSIGVVVPGVMGLALPSAAGVFGGLYIRFLRLFKRHPHADRYMFIAPRYWRGKHVRDLRPGQPPANRKRRRA